MDVMVTSNVEVGPSTFFDGNGAYVGNTIMGRTLELSGQIVVNSGYGLVTGFSTSVPEPSTFLLLGAGLAGDGLLRRRVKK
jgi:hypothetical protein